MVHDGSIHILVLPQHNQYLSSVNISDMTKRAPSLRLILVTSAVSLAGPFHFGFQLVLTNPAQNAFIGFLRETVGAAYGLSHSTIQGLWSLTVAILFLGALLGSLGIRLVSTKIGRKRGLYFSIGIGIIAGVISILSFTMKSFISYFASRVLMGISVSMNIGLAALFINEISPTECRGALSMFTGISIQLGTVLAAVVAMPAVFGTPDGWYKIYVIEVTMMIFALFAFFFFPESPNFLVMCEQREQAQAALQYYHQISEEDAVARIKVMEDEQHTVKKVYSMFGVLKKRSLRKRVFIGIVVTFAMAFSGVAVVNGFAFDLLREVGLSPMAASLANLGVSVVSLFAAVFSSTIIDKFGRRKLLLFTFVPILMCNVFIAALMYYYNITKIQWAGMALIFVICCFIVFFATGPGPLCYFINAELVGVAAKSSALSWTSVVQMLSRFVLLTAYLPLKEAIGSALSYTALFIIPVFFGIVFIYFRLPETKNRTISQVDEEIKNLPRLCGRIPVSTDMKECPQL